MDIVNGSANFYIIKIVYIIDYCMQFSFLWIFFPEFTIPPYGYLQLTFLLEKCTFLVQYQLFHIVETNCTGRIFPISLVGLLAIFTSVYPPH